MTGKVLDKTSFGGRIIEFTAQGVFDDIIQEIGEMPLPPYIHEKLEDKDRYQTVYAREKGRPPHLRRGFILRRNYWNA